MSHARPVRRPTLWSVLLILTLATAASGGEPGARFVDVDLDCDGISSTCTVHRLAKK